MLELVPSNGHSHLGIYFGVFSFVSTILLTRGQLLADALRLRKDVVFLWLSVVTVPWLYLRPILRKKVGSAQRGFVSSRFLFTTWICASLLLHVPGLHSLGLELDVSLFLVLAICSLLALLVALLARTALIRAGLVPPLLAELPPGNRPRELATVLLINSLSIALTVSSYHGLCSYQNSIPDSKMVHALRKSVCYDMPHRAVKLRPFFKRLVFAASRDTWFRPSSDVADFEASPVLIMWATLVALGVASHLADILSLDRLLLTSKLFFLQQQGLLLDPTADLTALQDEGTQTPGRKRRASFSQRQAVDIDDTLGPGTTATSGLARGRRRLSFDLNAEKSRTSTATLREPLLAPKNGVPRPPATFLGGTSSNGWDEELRVRGGGDSSRYGQGQDRDASGAHWWSNVLGLDGTSSTEGDSPMSSPRGYPSTTGVTGFSPTGSGASSPRWNGRAGSPAVGAPLNLNSLLQRDHVGFSSRENSASAKLKAGSGALRQATSLVDLGSWLRSRVRTARPPDLLLSLLRGEEDGQDRDAPRPVFQPMCHWFSLDLMKTALSLLVSVQVFLGRFDVRSILALEHDKRGARGGGAPPGSAAARNVHGGGHPSDEGAAASASTSRGLSAGQEVPRHGDGITFEHLKDRESVWVDFSADTGDGGNPTYAVARALAQPELIVQDPEGLIRPEYSSATALPSSSKRGAAAPVHVLPRGDLLVLGGDLAYPGPSEFTYTRRLLYPFASALQPPSFAQRDSLIYDKSLRNPDGTFASTKEEAAQNLKSHTGPTCLAIPGNHDHYDTLHSFSRFFLQSSWLGGWFLPQTSSYFALALPHGWWMYSLDLSLELDIDLAQFKYFDSITRYRLAPDDRILLVTHEPLWLIQWFEGVGPGSTQQVDPYKEPARQKTAPNLRQLLEGSLRGKVSVCLAGDLHFYSRHSLVPPDKLTLNPEDLRPPPSTRPGPSDADPKSSLLRGSFGFGLCDEGATGTSGWQPLFPTHLIVAGNGGAFAHPTHIFTAARLPGTVVGPSSSLAARLRDPSVKSLNSNASKHLRGLESHGLSLLGPAGESTSSSGSAAESRAGSPPLVSAPSRSNLHKPTINGKLGSMSNLRGASPSVTAAAPPEEALHVGEFRCFESFPRPNDSRRLFRNPWVFRSQNLPFDIVGGMFYFLIAVGGLPRCSVSRVLQAASHWETIHLFADEVQGALHDIVASSKVSIWFVGLLFLITISLAKGGGAGISRSRWVAPSGAKTRGGLYWGPNRPKSHLISALALGGCHALVHLLVAVSLAVLLELGVETLQHTTSLGKDGTYLALWRTMESMEAHYFPDPAGIRLAARRYTLGLYPGIFKIFLATFDLPTIVSVSRGKICEKGFEAVLRPVSASYLGALLAFFWLVATPAVSFVLGTYLFCAVNYLFLHFDEAFSALQVQDYKGFLRLRIDKDGSLNVYACGMDEVPKKWREDPVWAKSRAEGTFVDAPWHSPYPSRWIPCRKGTSRTARLLGALHGFQTAWTSAFLRRINLGGSSNGHSESPAPLGSTGRSRKGRGGENGAATGGRPGGGKVAVRIIDHLVVKKPMPLASGPGAG